MSSIRGTNVLAPVVPFDTTDSHASHEARYGKGGYRSVADLTERDAIPALRREAGMLVCVLTDGKVWKLGDNLTTWTEFAASSDWATLSGKPSTFPPSSHTHTASQITDFSSAVAAAAPPTTDASLLTSGTLSASRLPASAVLTGDSRLSDARTPTAHSHAIADVSGLQTALNAKATPADVTAAVAAVVNASPASLDTLAELAAALNNDASFSATVTNALAAKAPIASPTFTGTVSGVTKTMVGLGSVDNTADASKPVSTAQAAADSAVASAAASDATSKANTAQTYAIQRANHTGTQAAATVSDFSAAALSATAGSYAAASHTHTAGQVSGLATVATSGSYADLSNKPSIPAAYSLPVATSAVLGGVKQGSNVTIGVDGTVSVSAPVTTLAAGAITGLATIATSGAYADLSGKPSLFSGSYADLTSVPASFVPSAHNQAWSTITATPTTLSGYGITDAVGSSDSRLSDARTPTTHTHPLSSLTQSSAATGQVVTWNGTAWTPETPAGSSSSLAAYSSVQNFPATGSASALYLDESSSRLYQWESPVYVEIGVSGGGTATTSASDLTSGTLADARLSANVVLAGDSRLTDSRTPASHVHGNVTNAGAIGSTSGQIVVTTASGVLTTAATIAAATQVSGLASVATSGSAADLSGTLADARLSSSVATYSTMAASFNTPSNAVDIYPRGEAYSAAIPVTSGYVRAVFFTPTRTMTVSSITMASGATLASGLTTAQMALYSFNETTATLLARTASDTSLFTASETSYTRSFLESGGYPATYTLQAGSRYAVGAYLVGTTMPTLFGKATAAGGSAITPRTSGLSSFSATLLTSWTVSANIYLAWARLS